MGRWGMRCGILGIIWMYAAAYIPPAWALKPLVTDGVKLMPNAPFLNIYTPNDNNKVSIGFTGQSLRIYGTTNVKGNIIVVIEGADTIYTLSKKTKKSIFWLDQKVVKTIKAPQFYAINTLYALREYAHQNYPFADIGIYNITYSIADISADYPLASPAIWKKVTRLKQYEKSYQYNPMGIHMISPYLFETYIRIPSDMSPGVYRIMAFVDDAPTYQYIPTKIVVSDEKAIYIGRSPLIKFIYTSARDYSSLYGIIVILCSLGIGLGVGFMRRRR